MIPMGMWVTVRQLYASGKSIRHISRELGFSRNTVRKAIRSCSPFKYRRKPYRNSVLEQYRDRVDEMLGKGFIGTRIMEELRKQGVIVPRTTFYRYLKGLKAQQKGKAVMRFETPAGLQAQFDWSPYTLKIGGELTKVTIFSFILGYSRYQHFFVSLKADQASCFEALEDSFFYVGGVPKELLVDNSRIFVINPSRPHFEWNRFFLEFCGHYMVRAVVCRVRSPQTKGKVEKPFYHLEQHFIKGREFGSFEDFIRALGEYEGQRNRRLHPTTLKVPQEALGDEKPYFSPLPSGSFISTKEAFRKVSHDCLVAFGGNRYSVPHQYAAKMVWVKTSQGRRIRILSSKGELLAEHGIAKGKGRIFIDEAHYEGLRKRAKGAGWLKKEFLELFPSAEGFVDGVFAQQKYNYPYHLSRILHLAHLYPRQALQEAFLLAEQHNTYSWGFIKGVLEAHYPLEQEQPERMPISLRVLPRVSIRRDLEAYRLGGGS